MTSGYVFEQLWACFFSGLLVGFLWFLLRKIF